MVGTVKSDAKLMIWGSFAAHGVEKLHKITGIMDSDVFIHVLESAGKQSIQKLYPKDDWFFQ